MDILGVGFPELVLIFIIALMVFGPRRLPEIAVKIGKTIADLRNMSQGLMTEWQREITVAARIDELEKARQEVSEITQEIQQAKTDIASVAADQAKELDQARQDLNRAKQEVQQAATPPSPPVDGPETPAPETPDPGNSPAADAPPSEPPLPSSSVASSAKVTHE